MSKKYVFPKDVCPYCKHERDFGLYAAAHWQERLDTTREECDRPYQVLEGRAYKRRTKRKRSPGSRYFD